MTAWICYAKIKTTNEPYKSITFIKIFNTNLRGLHRIIYTLNEASSNCFHIVFHTILPYVTPIAVQTALVLQKDLEGVEINNIHNYSSEVRMQNIHISIFPLEDSTAVIMFYHRRDKNYRRLLHQFNCLTDVEKLCYINYWIFKYTENYFLAPSFKREIDYNSKLVQLSRENDELPNLGYVEFKTILQYKAVKMDEIPNLLTSKYAMPRRMIEIKK